MSFDKRKLLSTTEAAKIAGWTSGYVTKLCRTRKLPGIQEGREWYVARKELDGYLRKLEQLKEKRRDELSKIREEEYRTQSSMPVAEAAANAGLTPEYLAKLRRKGALAGERIGNAWHIKKDSLKTYLASNVERKENTRVRLKNVGEAIYKAAAKRRETRRRIFGVIHTVSISLALAVIAFGIIDGSVGVFAKRAPQHVATRAQVAGTTAVPIATDTQLASAASAMPDGLSVPAQAVWQVGNFFGGWYDHVTDELAGLFAPRAVYVAGNYITPKTTVAAPAKTTVITIATSTTVAVTVPASTAVNAPVASVSPHVTQNITQQVTRNVTEQTIVQGVSQLYVDSALASLESRLVFSIDNAVAGSGHHSSGGSSSGSSGIASITGGTIDGTVITGSSFDGSSLTLSGDAIVGGDLTVAGTLNLASIAASGPISAPYFTGTSAATSTFAGGIAVTGGCVSVNGVCLGTGSGTGTPGGASGELQFNNAGVLGGVSGVTYDGGSAFAFGSTTIVALKNAAGGLLKTGANGVVTLAVPGSDFVATTSGNWTGTFGGNTPAYYLNANNFTNFGTPFYTFFHATTTDALAEGSNLYFTNARADARVAAGIAGTTTDSLAEGLTNKYYTDGRVQTYLDTLNKSYFFATSSADFWKTQNNFFSTTSSNSWLSTKTTGDLTEGSNLYFTNARADARVAAGIAGTTTDALAEGTTNQYFSNARARAALSVSGLPLTYATSTGVIGINQSSATLAGYLSSADWNTFNTKFATSSTDYYLSTKSTTNLAEGTNLYYTQARFDTAFAAKSTTNLAEGSNLYYTDGRVQTYLDTIGKGYFFSTTSAQYFLAQNQNSSFSTTSADSWLSTKTTGDLTEGSNLYFTNARADARVAAALAGTTTDALTEGTTNLYFSNARARNALSAGSGLTYATSTGIFSLNTTGDWNGTFDGQEGAYYLDARNSTNFGTPFYTYFHATTTDALAQGSTNRYYSDTLARGALSSTATGLSYNNGTGIFSLAAGYAIPLTASTTDWNTAYVNRITSVLSPLSIANNVLSISTTTFSGTGSNLNADFLDGLDSTYFLANSFSTTSANAYLATKSTTNLAEGSNLYFTNARADARVAAGIAGTTTDALAEGTTNQYFSNARARAALSVSGLPLTYATSTGVIGINQSSATLAGYLSSADWNTFNNKVSSTSLSALAPLAYNSASGLFSISLASSTANGYLSSTDWSIFNAKQSALTFTYPLVNTANTISLAFGTTTANTWSQLQTFTGGFLSQASSTVNGDFAATGIATFGTIHVGGIGTSTISGDIGMSGSIIPTLDNTYSLGSLTKTWRDIYVGPGSLYVNGQEVVHTDASNNVVVSSDVNENLELKTTGTANIELNPVGTGQVLIKSNINLTGGKSIVTSDLSSLLVPNGVDAGHIRVNGNAISATNTNGGISLTPLGIGGVYVTSGNFGIGTTSPQSALTVVGNGTFSGNVSAAGTTTTASLSIGSLNGFLKATAGTVGVAVAGTDFLAPNSLTATYPIQYSTNNFSLAFGTTTANTWSALQTFANGYVANASSTVAGAFTVTGNASANALTLSNALGVISGGTGTSTAPTIGQILVGNGGGGYNLLATSSLGIAIADTTGVLAEARGGTGISTYTAGDILYADNSGILTKLAAGSSGSVLKIQAGLPSWGVDQTIGGGGSDGIFATSTGKIYPLNTADILLIGTNSTTTANSIFEVSGQSYFSSKIGIATTSPTTQLSVVGNALITGGIGAGVYNQNAGTIQSAGNITVGAQLVVSGTGTSTIAGSLSVPNLALTNNSGLLKASAGGYVQNAIGGVDYVATTTGDWNGTFDGQEGSYYLNANNITNFGSQFYTYFHATTTNALAEGNANLYYTDARVGSYITASTTLPAFLNYWTKTGTNLAYSGGNVGVGSDTPVSAFSVSTTSAANAVTFYNTAGANSSASVLSLEQDGNASNWIKFFRGGTLRGGISSANSNLTITSGVNDLLFATGANATGNGYTTRLFIQNSTGNIGIGTTTPDAALSFAQTTGDKIHLYSSGSQQFGFGVYPAELRSITGAGAITTWGTQNGAGSFTELMRLTSAGNLGIGTSSPAQALQVNGVTGIGLGPNGGSVWPVITREAGTGGLNVQSYDKTSAVYTTRLTVQSGGNVGIGTTSPLQALSVAGNGLFTGNLSTAGLTATGTVAFTNLGTGLVKSTAGTLSIASDGTDFISSSTFGSSFYNFFHATTTDALSEGTTNLYFTNARADARADLRINATSTISTLTSAPNLGTISTSLSGILKASSGVLSAATLGTDYINNSSIDTSLELATILTDETGAGSFVLNRSPILAGLTSTSTVQLDYTSADNFSTGFNVRKRGATGDATASVANGGELGYNSFYGWDGTAYARGAYVLAKASEAWSLGANGTRYQIATTPNGSAGAIARVTVDQNGNFGIGTSVPISPLAVVSNGSGANTTGFNLLSTTSAVVASIYDNATTGGTGVLRLLNGGSITTQLNANGINYINGGNLGIGTTSPYAKLSVTGDIALTGGLYDSTATRGTTGQILQTTGTGIQWVATSTLGYTNGTVTSINASGGTTGLSFSGGPVTTSGTLTLAGTLGVANGGTGSTTLSGILKGNGTGSILTAVAGTDYQAPLAFTYPLLNTANTISLAFGTTTANSWSQLQQFNGGASTTNLTITGNTFFPGSGIWNSSGNVGVGTTTVNTGLTIGTGNLYVYSTTNRSTLSAGRLALNDSYAGTGGGYIENVSGSLNLNASSANITFLSAGSEKARITSTGRLGIGTTTPASLLTVTSGATIGADIFSAAPANGLLVEGSVRFGNGAATSSQTITDALGATFTPQLQVLDVTGPAGISVGVPDGTNNRRIGLFVDQTNGVVGLSANYSTGQPDFVFRNGASELFRVAASGNFGIGTSSPSTALHIDSRGSALPVITISATGAAVQSFGRASANFTGAAATDLGIKYSNKLWVGNTSVPSFVVEPTGRVGIGTTTPNSLLAVAGSTFLGGNLTATGTVAFTGLGTGLVKSTAGTLSIATDGTDFISSSTFGSSFYNFFHATTTDALSEGTTNLYFTNDRADARADLRINATSTIATLTSAPSLGTVATSLTGVLKASSGVLSAAVAGTDYENPLTFTYPLVRTTNTIALAFGTTTANTWSQLQTLTNGFISQASSTVAGAFNVVGTSYFNGNVGIGSSSPSAKLQVAADMTSYPTTNLYSQFEVTGATIPGLRLSLGYNTSSDKGFIQAIHNASGFRDLLLNPSGGNVGVGTTSPSQRLSVQGSALFAGDVALANLTATGTATVNALSVGSLSGLLYGTSGAVAAATVSSPLSFTGGVLSISTSTFSGSGSGLNADLLDGLDSTYFTNANNLTNFGNPFYTFFHATTTDALAEGSTNKYYSDARARSALSTTATGLSYATSTGVLSLTAGYAIPLTASTTDWNTAYLNRITSAVSPLSIANNVISFATSTISGSGSNLNADFLDGLDSTYFLANSFSTTSANSYLATKTTDNLTEGATNKYFSNTLARLALSAGPSGLLTYNNSTGVIDVDNSQNWAGTFNGHSGSYYLDRANHTGTQLASTVSDFAAAADARINATSTISTLTSAPNLGTIKTSLSGLLKASSGVLSAAVAGTDYVATTTGDWNGTFDGQEGSYYLDARNQTNFGNPFYTFFHATTTDALTQGSTNKYYSDTLARAAFSSTATGLTYTSGTGVFSLTSGYNIPLTASTTNWNGFYDTPSTRITAGTNLAWSGNTLNGPADSYIRGLFSAASPLAYNSGTGAFTFSTSTISGSGSGLNADFLDGLDSAYFLANSFSTTSSNYWLTTKSTTNLAEGSNLYYTDARADARINATSTISTLTSAPNLGTIKTSLGGILKASSGVLSAATLGTDYINNSSIDTSAEIAAIVGDETGSGALVFGTSPTISAAILTGVTSISNASTTNFSANTLAAGQTGTTSVSSTGALTTPSLKIGTLSGLLYGNNGSVATATVSSPLSFTGGVLSISTSTFSGSGSGLNADLLDGLDSTYFLANSFSTTSTNYWLTTKTTDDLTQGTTNKYFSNTLARLALSAGPSGLLTYNNSTGVIDIDNSQDWAGTFNNHSGSYYLNRANHTGTQLSSTISDFGSAFYNLFHATTTDALAEGSTNLYFTNARADARADLRINATSTIATLTSAPNLGTVATSLTGFLKATSGVLSTASINLASDITGTLPVANGGTGSTTLSGILKGNGTSAVGTAVAGDFPTLNQNTTGSAATLTTPRNINGVAFNGSADITVTAAAGTLTGTTLNSTVTASSLTSVGTIATGIWQGTVVAGQYGGTGVANTGKTITLGGNLTTSGAFATTLTSTATTNVTLPTAGTLATLAGIETLTNKTISGSNNAITNVSLTSGVTGTLPVANGGTGSTTLSGLLKGNGTGAVATAIAGVDYQPAGSYLTGNDTITLSGDVSGTGTSTIITTIGAGKVTNGMLAGSIAASKLIGTDIISLANLATVGTITSGTWQGSVIGSNYGGSGAVNGILKANGSGVVSAASAGTDYFVPSAFGSSFYNFFHATTTDALAEGTTNLYFTNARADARADLRINATSTISTLTSAPNLGTIKTSLTGLLKASSGVLSAAVAGTDYYAPGGTDVAVADGGTGISTAPALGQLLIGTAGGGYTLTGTSSLGIALTDTTGTLPVSRGGTGANTLTGILLGNGTSAVTTLTTSAGIAGAISDETGSGALVFGTSPTISGATLSGITSIANASTSAFSANTLSVGQTGTTSISSTGAIIAPSLTLATALGAASGGTGNNTYTIGDILYASGSTALSKLNDAATGNVLVSGGVGVAPSWGKVGLTTHVSGTLAVGNGGTGAITLTGLVKGNGTGAFTAAVAGTDYLAPASLSATYPVQYNSGTGVISLAFGTTTSNTWAGTQTFGTLVATNATLTSAAITNASTTALSANILSVGQTGTTSVSSTGALTTPSLTIGSLSGLLYGNAGAVAAASVSSPLSFTGGVLSISTSTFSGSGSGLNADLLDGLDSTYFLANSFSTTSANSYLATKNTDALAEGSTNLYFTNARADARINATSTISTLMSAPNLGTVATSLTGFLKATAGVLSTASINLASDITGTLPVANGGTGSTTLSGLLKGNGTGVVATAIAGVDYQPAGNYLTGNDTITLSGDVSGTGTSSIVTTIGAGKVTNNMLAGSITASKLVGTDIATVGTITAGTWNGSVIGSNYGGAGSVSGILKANGSGVVSAAVGGTDYFVPSAFGSSFYTFFHATTTDALAEGSTNLYFTNARADARADLRINATSTISTLTSAPNLGTVATSLTGLLKASSGVLSAATLGTDYINNASIDTSAEIAAIVGDETGSGALVFGTSPTISGATFSGVTSITNASTTNLSANTLSVGQTGTTTIASTGAITAPSLTLATALTAANGGTGNNTYTIGDILYASGATTLSKLNDAATGNVLISGGAGVAPSWGKVGLTTHVSGTLAVGNGGTGAVTLTGILLGNGTSAVTALTTSAGISGALSDETGSGALVFGTSPTISGATLTGITSIANASTSAFSANTLAVGQTGTTTISSTGALTTPSLTVSTTLSLPANSVTNTMLAGSIAFSKLIGTDITSLANLVTVGTITSGTWNGTVVAGQYGGTGVANTGKTITLGNNLTTSGNFALTLTQTGTTNVTLPTTGTLATLAGIETLSNKTFTGLTTFASASTTALTANTFAAGQTGTTSISSTGALTTPSLTIGSLVGVLHGTAGAISASNVLLGSEVTGTLPVANGGTGSTTLSGILKGNGTGAVGTAVAADFPTLNQNTTGSAATLTTPRNINGVAFNGSADITVTAAAGTLTGGTLASGVTASSLTSLGTLTSLTVSGQSTLANASTTNLSANTAAFGATGTTSVSSTGALTTPFLTIGSLAGLLYANAGAVAAASVSSPLSFSGGVLSISTSTFSGSGSNLNADLLDGLDSTYFLTNSFSTTSANAYLATKSTTNLAEGTNLYFTNARADARINATSTISTLTSAPNLGTVSTGLSGILKASSGVLSAAIAGTDYYAPGSTDVAIADGGTNASSQTTNGVNYFDGTKITSGSVLSFDGTSLGLSSTTPSGSKLAVNGVSSPFGTLSVVAGSGVSTDLLLGIWGDANPSISRFAVTRGGNVGIGTSSPFTKFSVAGDAYIGGNLTTTGTVAFTGLSSGLIKSTSGVLSAATLGTDYINNASIDTSAELAAILTDEQGSGALVFATSPTLTTPVLGAATATSINKVTITAPATSAILTLATGSSLITSGANSLTLTTSGTTNATFPAGTITLADTSSSQTLTNKIIDGSFNTITNVSLTTGVTGQLPIANGGTNTNVQTSNGVAYFDGTKITSGSTFVFNGTNAAIGTTPVGSNNRLTLRASSNATFVSDYAFFMLDSSGNSGFGITVDASNAYIDSTAAKELQIGARSGLDTYINPGSGNVGIGTATVNASNKLTISGNVSLASSGLIGFAGSSAVSTSNYALSGDSSNTIMNVATGGALRFRINNSDQVTIDSGGKVGIGTSTPDAQLQVYGNSATINSAEFGNLGVQSVADTNGIFSQNSYWDGTNIIYRKTGPIAMIQFGTPSSGDIDFRTAVSGTAGTAASSLTDVLTLKNTGNVGIGTTNPGSLLQVGGTVSSVRNLQVDTNGSITTRFDNNALNRPLTLVNRGISAAGHGTGILFQLANGAGSAVSAATIDTVSENTTFTGATADASLVFNTAINGALTESMRITSAGFVGIGTTTPSSELHLNRNSAILPAITFSDTTAADVDVIGRGALAFTSIAGNHDLGISYPSGDLYFGATAAPQIAFRASGNVGIGTSTPRSTLTVQGSGCFSNSATTGAPGTHLTCGIVAGDIYFNNSHTGNYDVAEIYPSSSTIAPATLVGLDTLSPGSVKTARGDGVLLGVITTAPGLTLGGADGSILSQTHSTLALTGRTPVAVSNENGSIAVGDRLTLSATQPGVAVKAVHSGQTIGIALAAYSGSTNGSIDMFITNQYWFAPDDLSVDPTNGKVAIGKPVTNTHLLDVNGDVSAKTFIAPKTDLNFRIGTSTIAAVIPSAVLSADTTGVDLYKLGAYTLASNQLLTTNLQNLAMKVDSLDTRIARLENRSIAMSTTSPALPNTGISISSITDAIQSTLAGFGVTIQKGIAQFGTLVAHQLVFSKDANGDSAAGAGSIIAGNTVTEITNPLVKASSKIFVTFTAPFDGSWYLSEKKDGSFRVVLAKAQSQDVTFDYFTIQTEGQIASVDAATTGNTSDDHTAPTVTMLGDSTLHLSIGDTYSEPGVTAVDGVDGTLTYQTLVDGTAVATVVLDSSKDRTYVLTYKATDAAGNIGKATRTILIGSGAGATGGDGGSSTTPDPTPDPVGNPPVVATDPNTDTSAPAPTGDSPSAPATGGDTTVSAADSGAGAS